MHLSPTSKLGYLSFKQEMEGISVVYQNQVELAWHSGSVIDRHTTAQDLIPGGNSVLIELHVLCKGQ